MTFQNSHVRFYVCLIVPGEGRHTIHLLRCGRQLSTSQTDWRRSSDSLSDIDFILTVFLTFFLTYLLTFCLAFFLTYLLTFCLAFFLTHLLTFCLTYLVTLFLTYLLTILSNIHSGISCEIISGISSDILSGIFSGISSDISCDSLSGRSYVILSDISSNSLVRQGTLNSHDRGWGPARKTELTSSRLRSGKKHWAHIIAVGDEEDEEDEEEEAAEEKTTHIKSNKPHLTGGE